MPQRVTIPSHSEQVLTRNNEFTSLTCVPSLASAWYWPNLSFRNTRISSRRASSTPVFMVLAVMASVSRASKSLTSISTSLDSSVAWERENVIRAVSLDEGGVILAPDDRACTHTERTWLDGVRHSCACQAVSRQHPFLPKRLGD